MDPSPSVGLRRGHCFPRRRGDGPPAALPPIRANSFPPQARGWTVRPRQAFARRSVSPAGAGMDPAAKRPIPPSARFPRRRGDGPVEKGRKDGNEKFPPQARGWTVLGPDDADRIGVSPAGAGMDPPPRPRGGRRSSFPRRRGDGPEILDAADGSELFPPQARGWTLPCAGREKGRQVSPAGAGMDRCGGWPGGCLDCFPRRRGDGPSAGLARTLRARFPPQARGWTSHRAAHRFLELVSPAGAGMDLIIIGITSPPMSFPRRRGDGPPAGGDCAGSALFPPQARGWTALAQPKWQHPGVSPAGAGMDPSRRSTLPSWRRFPRRRGDGPGSHFPEASNSRFPPQARGWTCRGGHDRRRRPVSPAGAGMDPWQPSPAASPSSFPRRRGDGPRARRPQS